ncbi:hypothetical protein THIOSC13_130003 [uncultured Thiomicrorhabdus sp.]
MSINTFPVEIENYGQLVSLADALQTRVNEIDHEIEYFDGSLIFDPSDVLQGLYDEKSFHENLVNRLLAIRDDWELDPLGAMNDGASNES